MAENKPRPVAEFRIGYVKAAVWRNGDFYNTTLSKRYKEKDSEEWKDADSLGSGDLLNAAKVLTRAEAFIAEQ